jgi:tetratricopeptide (TPR) repeat protein/tRNA A-37 threonylcarbamoyl transferase component Bud32
MPDPSSTAAADRNLLFGLLALQADFISREALVAALEAWVFNKSRPVDQFLLDQGALAADTHALLLALVQKHLALHDHDPGCSLAAIFASDSTRHDLRQIADADFQADLTRLSVVSRRDQQPGAAPPAAAPAAPVSSGQRFRVLRPHARGGLGQVSVAEDQELHREVALKEIQGHHADDPDSRWRFVLEAEITGRLEHPGVVPVYGLGTDADGRPWYAMRFIQGDSLKQAIARFHQTEGSGREPGQRELAFRQLLGRFLAVCNTVAYAHARGILHRDLKPENIMLGPYGETLVVDWGLAKPVGHQERPAGSAEQTLRPVAASGSNPTQLGSVVGTPPFMSPEQARGQLDRLGPASDVYSLGATLYQLLTGQPPFQEADVWQVLARVQRGDFPPPRAVQRDVPAALEAVCLKAMALDPAERYHSALALAADLEHWLADEPVRAWREPWRRRAGRWARRHKAWVAAAAAGVLVALLAAGAGAWWLERQRLERRQAVEAALDKAGELQKQARWGEAQAVLEQARERLELDGPADLRRRVQQARADLQLVDRLDAARLKAATIVESHYDEAGAERGYAAAFRQARLGQVGDEVATVAARLRASAVKAQLVAALDDWASLTQSPARRAWLLAVARGADPDPWRDRFRDPKLWQDRKALQRLARQAKVQQLSPQLVAALATVLAWRGGDALGLLTAAQRRSPQDFWLNFQLGNALQEAQKPGEAAIGYYRAALALRPKASAVYHNLGVALAAKGERDEAITCFQQALALDPKLPMAHTNLGNALQEKGDLDGAIACYHKALAIDPKYAPAHTYLGAALAARGELEGAIACYQKALALDPKYAFAHGNLGQALLEQGHLRAARASTRRCLQLLPPREPLRPLVSQQLQQCERLLVLEARLPAILKGERAPASAAEGLAYARLCQLKKYYAAAARFSADAFAADPKLADNLLTGHRYNAACSAALAAAGQGEDARKLDDKERARLRQQALDWLRADLVLRSKQLASGQPADRAAVQQALRHWQQDSDLAGLRDQEALAKLSAQEQKACTHLWADVAALLKRAGSPK